MLVDKLPQHQLSNESWVDLNAGNHNMETTHLSLCGALALSPHVFSFSFFSSLSLNKICTIAI